MESPEQRVAAIQAAYELRYKIEHQYAVHRKLPESLLVDHLKSAQSTDSEVMCVEIDATTSTYLKSFGYTHITKYCSRKKDHDNDVELLRRQVVIPERYYLLILVLMTKATWGLPMAEGNVKRKIIAPKNDFSDRCATEFDKAVQMIEVEFDLRNGDDPQERGLNEIPILDKVIFQFRNPCDDTTPEKYEIKAINGEINPVAEMIGISIRDQLGGRNMPIHEGRRIMDSFQPETSSEEVPLALSQSSGTYPYKQFCYKFVNFFEDELSDLSRNELYRVYHQLLMNAGYGFGSGDNYFWQIEAYYKKWYNAGRESQVKS